MLLYLVCMYIYSSSYEIYIKNKNNKLIAGIQTFGGQLNCTRITRKTGNTSIHSIFTVISSFVYKKSVEFLLLPLNEIKSQLQPKAFLIYFQFNFEININRDLIVIQSCNHHRALLAILSALAMQLNFSSLTVPWLAAVLSSPAKTIYIIELECFSTYFQKEYTIISL